MREGRGRAVEAGAFGVSTSRTNSHKTPAGEMVPGRYSEVQELLGIGSAFKGLGYGAFGVNSDFDNEAEELKWMTRLGQDTGRPVWFLLTDRPTDTVRWRRLMDGVHKARGEGCHGHRSGRRPPRRRHARHRYGAESIFHPPKLSGVVAASGGGTDPPDADPALRAQILSEAPSPALLNRLSQFRQHIVDRWHRMFPMGDPPNYEPHEQDSIAAMAARSNHSPTRSPTIISRRRRERFLFFPMVGYVNDDHEPIHTMLSDDVTLGLVRRRRPLLVDRRCQRAELHAHPLGARPHPRAKIAAGTDGEAANQ